METKMMAEMFTDKIEPNDIRVEFIDGDGGCEVAIFAGPRALERARRFAEVFYGTFNDASRSEGG